MKVLGIKREDTKKRNRGQVLKLIAQGTCSNRRELVTYMGLTKMAISNIVTELVDKGLLMEGEISSLGNVGRNPVTLRIPQKAPKVIGILILRDRCESVLCDLYLNILKRKRIELRNLDKKKLIAIMYELIDEMIQSDETILGIGVSAIGPLDRKRGLLLTPPYFFNIHDLPVKDLIEERYGLPVVMNQDNQSAALVELMYGNGQNRDRFILLGIARGVGCGIVKNGVPYETLEEPMPEIGHVSIDHKGKKCVCGNRGCLELYVNTYTLTQKLQRATGQILTFSEFCEGRKRTDAAEMIFEEMTEQLAAGLVSAVNLLNLELILLGYDGVYLPERYVRQLEDRINMIKFAKYGKRTEVKKAYFLQDAQLLGAVCNVFQEIYEGRLLME